MASQLVPLRLARPAGGGERVAPARGRVYLETYGCQMNVADSDLMVGLLQGGGYERVDDPAHADVILINTCAVREKAEERVLARARELAVHKRRRAILGITGCMAEHLKDKLVVAAPWVDVIAGPDSYRRLPGLVEQARAGQPAPLMDVTLSRHETYQGLDGAQGGDGVSGFVTIQRGCDKFCTFCVVPLTRGRERAVAPREILRQVRAYAAAGYKEVTLLGQTVSSYQHEEAGFAGLLRAVAQVDGIERIRFTSPYPVDFSSDVIDAIAGEPKVCKHVHLPVQSGSDAVLTRMARGYDVGGYRAIAAELRARVPGLALTTDILVGFSGETEDDHGRTLALMEELAFDNAFLFAYSEREGTQAARRLPDDVPPASKQRRLAEAIKLQERLSLASNQRTVGTTVRVLVHGRSKRRADELTARTGSFKAVIVPRGTLRPGDFTTVRIDRATSATLFGTPLSA